MSFFLERISFLYPRLVLNYMAEDGTILVVLLPPSTERYDSGCAPPCTVFVVLWVESLAVCQVSSSSDCLEMEAFSLPSMNMKLV